MPQLCPGNCRYYTHFAVRAQVTIVQESATEPSAADDAEAEQIQQAVSKMPPADAVINAVELETLATL